MLHRAAALFAERQNDFTMALVSETGSGLGKAMFECSLVPLALAEAAGLTTREVGEIYPSQVPGKINRTVRTPAGVEVSSALGTFRSARPSRKWLRPSVPVVPSSSKGLRNRRVP